MELHSDRDIAERECSAGDISTLNLLCAVMQYPIIAGKHYPVHFHIEH